MSHRALYLKLNKPFASRAALFSLPKEESHLDHALLPFVVNLATLAHFADVAAAYIGMKVLDHLTEERITKIQTALKQFVDDLRGRSETEQIHPSADLQESDKLIARADQALDPFFVLLPTVNPPVLELSLKAGQDAAYAYLRHDLKLPHQDATFLAQAVENELRAALAIAGRSSNTAVPSVERR
jgi:hypothetical protein